MISDYLIDTIPYNGEVFKTDRNFVNLIGSDLRLSKINK